MAEATHSHNIDRATIAKEIGWHSISGDNMCRGYYLEPKLKAFNEPSNSAKQSKTSITADSAVLSQKGPTTLNNVTVIQSGRKLTADKAILHTDPKTGKLISIDLIGNVHGYEPGKVVVGTKAHLELNTQSATIDNAIYRIALASDADLPEVLESYDSKTNKVT